MKRVVKIRIYEDVIAPRQSKQVTLADPTLAEGVGVMSAGTGWLGTTGWSAVSGSSVATFASATQQGVLTQVFPRQLDESLFYTVSFDLSGVTGGGLDVYMGDERIGNFSGDGSYDVLWYRTGLTQVGQIRFVPVEISGVKFSGSILTDTVKINQKKEITPPPPEAIDYRVHPLEFIDLKEDFAVAYNWKLSDIKQLNDSKGGFSKQFNVPGSKHNQQIFGFLGTNNSTFNRMDLRNKFRADIVVDDNTLISGWLVVSAVGNDQSELEYSCNFYESTFGFYDAIRGKKVSDVDLSLYDHVLTAKNIFQTWDPDRTWQEAYTYPLLHLDGTNGLYKTIDFTPCLYNKYLFNQIVLDSGYGYTMSPEVDATFSKLLTVPNGKRRTVDQAVDGEAIFVASTVDFSYSAAAHTDFYAPFLREDTRNIPFNDDYLNGHYDPFSRYDTSSYEYDLTNPNTPHTFEFVINLTLTSIPSENTYNFVFIQLNTGGMVYDGSNPNLSGIKAWVEDPLGVVVCPSNFHAFSHIPDTASTVQNITISGITTVESLNTGIYKLKLSLLDNLVWTVYGSGFGSTNNMSYERSFVVDKDTSYYKVTPMLGGPVSDNNMMRMNKWLPTMDQEAFVNEHMNLFNLYAFETTDNRIKFISHTELYSDPYIIEWYDKVQYLYEVKPLTDIASSQIVLGYKETNDDWNNFYKAGSRGVQYGDFLFNNETNQFNESQENRSKIYGSTPMVNDQGGRVVPAIRSRDLPSEHRLLLQGDNLYPSGEKIFMDYYDPFNTYVSWAFDDNFHHEEDLGQGYIENVGFLSNTTPHGLVVGDKIRIRQTPVFLYNPLYNGLATVVKVVDAFRIVINKPWGTDTPVSPGFADLLPSKDTYRSDVHIDSLSASTVDINFGAVDSTLLTFPISITPNNLGNNYYLNKLIQNRDGKLYKVAVNLTPYDVRQMMSHIGSKIWVDCFNAYFHLYSINDFDPVTNGLTTVELIEVLDTEFDFPRGAIQQVPNVLGPANGTGLGGVFDPVPSGTIGVAIGGGPIGPANPNVPGAAGASNVVTQYGNEVRGGSSVVLGTGNNIYADTKGIIVAGDNNMVDAGVKNTMIVGSGVHATESSSLYLGNYGVFGPNRSELYGKTVFNNSGMSIDNVAIVNSGITVGGISGVTIVSTAITIGGLVFTSSGITTSGGTNLLLPTGQTHDMLYYSGSGWVARDMGIRVSDNASDWFKIGDSTNTVNTGGTTLSTIVGGSSNTITSGRTASIFGGAGNLIGAAGILNDHRFTVIAGGSSNSILGTTRGSGIVAASGSLVSGFTSGMNNGFIGGGTSHILSDSDLSAVIGGFGNQVVSSSTWSVSIGGFLNKLNASTYAGTFAGHNNLITASHRSAIIGGSANTMTSLTNAIMLGTTGLTASDSNTTYVNSLNVQQIADLKPLSVLPAAREGRVFYSAGTGLYMCTGTTNADWTKLRGGGMIFSGLPSGVEGDMLYHDGLDWIAKDMQLRSSSIDAEWVSLNADYSFSGSPMFYRSGFIGGELNVASGGSLTNTWTIASSYNSINFGSTNCLLGASTFSILENSNTSMQTSNVFGWIKESSNSLVAAGGYGHIMSADSCFVAAGVTNVIEDGFYNSSIGSTSTRTYDGMNVGIYSSDGASAFTASQFTIISSVNSSGHGLHYGTILASIQSEVLGDDDPVSWNQGAAIIGSHRAKIETKIPIFTFNGRAAGASIISSYGSSVSAFTEGVSVFCSQDSRISSSLGTNYQGPMYSTVIGSTNSYVSTYNYASIQGDPRNSTIHSSRDCGISTAQVSDITASRNCTIGWNTESPGDIAIIDFIGQDFFSMNSIQSSYGSRMTNLVSLGTKLIGNSIISSSASTISGSSSFNSIISSQDCSTSSAITQRYSSVIASSGVTATKAFTLYTQNANIQNILHLVPLTADPPVAEEGDVYFRQGVGPKFFDGSVWRTISFT